jgi:pimeloyl-ACP methyl ester carboxylesterase
MTRTVTLPATDPVFPPSLALMTVEPLRAAIEFAGMQFMRRSELPRGDGHTVMVFPGLASDQRALGPLKGFCRDLGYDAHDWGRGFNTGPHGDADAWLDELADEVDGALGHAGPKATLIGWSLGGIYARELAKRLQGRVRQVISIGTPFAGSPEHSNVGWIYRLLNGRPAEVSDALGQRLKQAPPVPTTSIYTRSDGIVAWQACVQQGGHASTENIEVQGSHCGLCWNAAVYAVLADRLAQPEGAWRPYAASRRAGSASRLTGPNG